MANYLTAGKLPPYFSSNQKNRIIRKSVDYSWIRGNIFFTGLDLIICMCVMEDEVYEILRACHDELCGGQFADKRTSYKILRSSYYWPSLFKDEREYVRKCESYQRMGWLVQSDEMPLQPQVLIEPFERWALHFVGPINPMSKGKKYILVCIDYVTKWVEARALPRATQKVVVDFLFSNNFVRFGVPKEIVIDQGTQFVSNPMQGIVHKYHITHWKSTPYHPQANGQVESTNKVLEKILTKTVQLHKKDWTDRLPEALWAYRITRRNTIGFSPYESVYGKQVLFPIEFQIRTFKMASYLGIDLDEAQQQRILQINELDEARQDSFQHTNLIQQQRAKWHDRYSKMKQFKEGDWAFLYDSKFKNFKGKFNIHWLGPYEIEKVFDNGSVHVKTIDNGNILKLYQKPQPKEEFVKEIVKKKELELM